MEKLIKQKTQQLVDLQGEDEELALGEINGIQSDLHSLMEQEDLQCRQRAKANWLKHKDRNTKYFHACANLWKRANHINKIMNETSRIWESQEDICQSFILYYQKLFSSKARGGTGECLFAMREKVTEAMNSQLLREFTVEEINGALMQMPPLNALGPDGFAACFYQENWASVGIEVCNSILGFLNSGNINNELNSTYIALIPKVKKKILVALVNSGPSVFVMSFIKLHRKSYILCDIL
jgi:hypothetical protein